MRGLMSPVPRSVSRKASVAKKPIESAYSTRSTLKPAAATLAYTEFLLATAATGGLGVVCAAMTPCMRLYAHIGSHLDAGTAGPYAQWVQTYADPGFEEIAALLERLLDQHGEDSPVTRQAYRRAMRLELEFFSAALTP